VELIMGYSSVFRHPALPVDWRVYLRRLTVGDDFAFIYKLPASARTNVVVRDIDSGLLLTLQHKTRAAKCLARLDWPRARCEEKMWSFPGFYLSGAALL
jgi:hypothetical protein